MEDITLQIGDKLKQGKSEYVVLNYNQNDVVLCELNTTKLSIFNVQTIKIFNLITTKKIELIKKDIQNAAVDMASLSESARSKYEVKVRLINDFEEEYGPMFQKLADGTRKIDGIDALKDKYASHFTNKYFWKTIRAYLQSGRDIHSLLPKERQAVEYEYKKKTGRPPLFGADEGVIITDEIKAQFDEAIRLYKSGRKHTFREVYERMIEKHYMTKPYLDENRVLHSSALNGKYPTYNQFLYYAGKVISRQEMETIKTSVREYRNNSRVIYSDAFDTVMGPCDLMEMDECAVDCVLVSQHDPSLPVRRPVVYLMVDIYSRFIMAYSVGFEDNSVLGLTNCLKNLAEDKKVLCAKHGVAVPDEFWPHHVLPNRIRTDYGAEYISVECKRIMGELNIQQDTVTPGTGSLKGTVEQWFHQMHNAQNPILEDKGMISKRHDSSPYEKAVLTIDEFETFLLMFVIEHNAKRMTDYPLSAEMIAAGMSKCPTPTEIYRFGVENYGQPRPIVNDSMYKYTLLKEMNFSLTRMGVTYRGLHYNDRFNEELRIQISSLTKNSEPFTARIDPRDISCVYVIQRGKLVPIPLSERVDSYTFAGWTLDEYEEYLKKCKEAKTEAEKINMFNSIARRHNQLLIASKPSVSKDRKRIADNSKEEKAFNRSKQALFREDPVLSDNSHILPEPENLSQDLLDIDGEEAMKRFASKDMYSFDEEEVNE